MKYLILIFLILMVLETSAKKKGSIFADKVDYYRHSLYFEIGGNTLSPSMNYQYVIKNNFFGKENLSMNVRIGIALQSDDTLTNSCIVSMINWQNGNENCLEFGAGLLYIFDDPQINIVNEKLIKSKYNYFYTFTWGYKHIWYERGLFIRIGITPIFSMEGGFQMSNAFSIGLGI